MFIMKMKLLSVLLVSALVLTVSGTSQAVSLKTGPVVFKTFNWEVSTAYAGMNGYTYFRDATTAGYDATNPNHLLFSDPTFLSFPTGDGIRADEDAFGLLELTQIWDGTLTGGGTDIASGVKYWDKGDNGEYLRGMFWGGDDQRVYFQDDGLGGQTTTIYTTDIQYNLYELDYDYTVSPQIDSDLEPGDRDGQDFFTGWRGENEGTLQMQGTSSWFRFIGDSTIGSVNGQTLVYLDVDEDVGEWGDALIDFWDVPTVPGLSGLFNDGAPTELQQTWTILQEGDDSPWLKSEDAGKGYVVPEPTTMLGVFSGPEQPGWICSQIHEEVVPQEVRIRIYCEKSTCVWLGEAFLSKTWVS